MLTRRAFLAGSLLGGAAVTTGCLSRSAAALTTDLADEPFGDATYHGNLPFVGEGGRRERLTGRGHEGRRRQDLSRLTAETLITPNDRFYVRTRCPDRIDYSRPWRVAVRGLADAPATIPIEEIRRRSRPLGTHLLECSGNGGSFGLMSTARWSGVPVDELLADVPAREGATRVLVNGFDEHSSAPRRSEQRGASWVFTRAELAKTGAFLAPEMNGEALPRDNGFPLRLVVPGWYGCACLKWVDRIELVGEDAAATAHMREFAGRTHQGGTPRRARDFRPAVIDLCAMPVRVEEWRAGRRTLYRAVGVIWGGAETTDRLEVRFGDREPYVPVESYAHETNESWSLWTHTWRPRRAGKHTIRLRVADGSIRTRRLDSGYYARTVDVGEA